MRQCDLVPMVIDFAKLLLFSQNGPWNESPDGERGPTEQINEESFISPR